MKVYISTYHNEINFGAALQSYALQNFLEKLGYEPKLINCKYDNIKKSNEGISIKTALKSLNSFYNTFYRNSILQGEKRFEEFFSQYHKTTCRYNNYEELCKNAPSDGVYISGSDQVFNPLSLNPQFFLQFGSEKIKRISYAASVGVAKIPDDRKEIFKKYLNTFDAISLRESYSEPLVRQCTDTDIHVNVDPSYLVSKSEWEIISDDAVADTIEEPYILVYVIYRPKWLNKALRRIQKKTKLKIVLVTNKNFKPVFCDKCIMNAGPREFLGLVKKAEMIISSSYHGNVFASIFEKPFYAIVNPNSPARIMSMLELFKLEDRILKPDTKVDLFVNYDYMKNKLPEEVKKSKEYLISEIEGV